MEHTDERESPEAEEDPLARRAFLGWAVAGAVGFGLVVAGCDEAEDDDDDDGSRRRRRRRRR